MYRASRWSAIGLIGDTGKKQYLTRAGFLMEAFTVSHPLDAKWASVPLGGRRWNPSVQFSESRFHSTDLTDTLSASP